MFSSAEYWNSVPLITVLVPYTSFWYNGFGVCVYAALCLITLNHATNHEFAYASNSYISGLRKMIQGFWTTSILDRIHLNLRPFTAYRSHTSSNEKVTKVEGKDLSIQSNRIVALWQAQSGVMYKTSYVWISVLFFVILISNLFGLIPLCEALTSKTGFTIGLSFAVWFTVTFCGIQCLSTKFVKLFLPSGLPWAMAPIFVLLEFISYTFRALSLGVRLWANLIAGHQLISLVSAMILVPALCLNVIIGAPITILAAGLLMGLSGLEFIVCFLQSGVFCLLASFYLNEALHTKNTLVPKG